MKPMIITSYNIYSHISRPACIKSLCSKASHTKRYTVRQICPLSPFKKSFQHILFTTALFFEFMTLNHSHKACLQGSQEVYRCKQVCKPDSNSLTSLHFRHDKFPTLVTQIPKFNSTQYTASTYEISSDHSGTNTFYTKPSSSSNNENIFKTLNSRKRLNTNATY